MVLPLAIMAGATLGAGALSALSGNSAAKKAAAASQYATDQSIGLQRDQFNQTQANLSPYMQAGQAGLGALLSRSGLSAPGAAPATGATRMDEGTGGGLGYYNPNGDGGASGQPMSVAQQMAGSVEPGTYGNTANPTLNTGTYTAPQGFSYGAADYQESPGLKFAIDRGVDAINSRVANNGSMYSGAAMKGIGEFVANTQLKDFQNERGFAQGAYTDQRNFDRANYLDDRNYNTGQYNTDRNYLTGRYDQQTGVVSNLAGIGQNAAAGVGNAGMAYANNAGQALQQNAANQGNAGLVASSNFSNLLGQGINALAYTQRPQTTMPQSIPLGSFFGGGA